MHPIQLQVLEFPPPLRNSLGCLIAGSMFVGQNVHFKMLDLAKPVMQRIESFNQAHVRVRIGKYKVVICFNLNGV